MRAVAIAGRVSPTVSAMPEPKPQRVGRTWSVRLRVITLVVAMLALGLVVAGAVAFTVQFNQLNQRIDGELLQEVDELRSIGERGPASGQGSYTDLEELFRAYLLVSVPNEHESMSTLVDGRTALIPGGDVPFSLDELEVEDAVATLLTPGQTRITDLELDGRDLRVAIASVTLPVDPRQGALVVAIDAGTQRQMIWQQVGTFALVALGTMILTGGAGFLVAGRLLRPLADLSRATATIDTEDLTQRVQIRSADNDVARLAQTFNQMLDRLEAGVADQRRFLDDAAHELRTPLTIIRGNLELMEVGDAEDVDSTRTLVLDELDRMKRLVDDLLMLARSQRPDFVALAPLDVQQLGHDLQDRVHLLGERQWETVFTATGTVLADRQRLQQAVIQLAANAVKFSEPESRITVRLDWAAPTQEVEQKLTAPAKRCLVLTVQDQGSGIAPDQLERIFERFGRSGEHHNVEGAGLGLPIVVAIARAHHGTVTVDSFPGQGSTFRIWVPGM